MYLKLCILFAIPLCSSLSIYFIPTLPQQVYKLLLVFGGSYLFSFMLMHMLPELFADACSGDYKIIGIGLLLGFFLQILLDFFSRGIAHGHVGITRYTDSLHLAKASLLVAALCMHALLDGVLLSLSAINPIHNDYNRSLLLGILLHKIPIAFTLGIMLNRIVYSQKIVFTYLFLFAAASPIGWLLAHFLQTHNFFSLQAWLIIRAVSLGNLLHVVTTILFESSPQHYFNAQKLCVLLAGGIMALVMIFIH